MLIGSQGAIETRWHPERRYLEIDSTKMVGRSTVVRICSWPDGLLTDFLHDEKGIGKFWDLGDWLISSGDDVCLDAWRGTVPSDVLGAVRSLPILQTRALWLACQSMHARTVLISNPLLFWAVVKHFYREPMESFPLSLFGRPQKELLELIGLPGSRAKLKTLSRLSSSDLRLGGAVDLLELMRSPQHDKYFSHTTCTSDAQLKVIKSYPWITACKARNLIPSLSDTGRRRIFEDTQGLLEDITPLRQCTNMHQLYALHDRLTIETNRRSFGSRYRRGEDAEILSFPLPPLQPDCGVEPITSQTELFREGREMGHCVAGYVDRVLKGGYYVYRVTRPSRLTIGVRLSSDGAPRLDEIKAARNRTPTEDELQPVYQWWKRVQGADDACVG